jgi:phosphoglycerol transferase MdoB-like AlkP superfamily enzyme
LRILLPAYLWAVEGEDSQFFLSAIGLGFIFAFPVALGGFVATSIVAGFLLPLRTTQQQIWLITTLCVSAIGAFVVAYAFGHFHPRPSSTRTIVTDAAICAAVAGVVCVVVESNGQSDQSQAMYLPNPVLVITWQTTVASLIGCVLVVRRGDATSQ